MEARAGYVALLTKREQQKKNLQEKALKEANKVGTIHVAYTGKAENFVRVPKQQDLKLTPNAAYVHLAGNETIHGVEFHALPDVGNVPLAADTSSHMLSRPLDIRKYAMMYAGAQKNIGPAGCTLVILRDDMLAKAKANPAYEKLPIMLQYGPHADDKSLHNTPPNRGEYTERPSTSTCIERA